MRMGRVGLGQVCLLIVLVLAACEGQEALTPEATPESALAPTTQGVEEVLLQQMAERICPYPDDEEEIDPYERYFTTGDGTPTFTCYPATGHSITVTLRRFADPARAEAEFQAVPELGPVAELEGFAVSDWQEQHPSFPGGRTEVRVRLLQAGPWLISIRSFDDTHFLIAPDPRKASLAILQVLREQRLAPASEERP
jgi:hypothetical protein